MQLRWPFPVFYPSARAAMLLALAAPLALVVAAAAPAAWIAAPALGAVLLVMVLLDALLAASLADVRVIAPADGEVGEPLHLTVLADFQGDAASAAPWAALALDPASVTANRRLGQIELSRGQYDLAHGHLDAAFRAAPGQQATRQLLGESLAVAGDAAGAFGSTQPPRAAAEAGAAGGPPTSRETQEGAEVVTTFHGNVLL